MLVPRQMGAVSVAEALPLDGVGSRGERRMKQLHCQTQFMESPLWPIDKPTLSHAWLERESLWRQNEGALNLVGNSLC